MALAYNKLTCR